METHERAERQRKGEKSSQKKTRRGGLVVKN
jgi:hypothetical protein